MTENKCNCAVLIKNDFAICNSFLNQIKNCCIIIFISFAWGFSFKIYWIKCLLNANGGSNIKKIAIKNVFLFNLKYLEILQETTGFHPQLSANKVNHLEMKLCICSSISPKLFDQEIRRVSEGIHHFIHRLTRKHV